MRRVKILSQKMSDSKAWLKCREDLRTLLNILFSPSLRIYNNNSSYLAAIDRSLHKPK